MVNGSSSDQLGGSDGRRNTESTGEIIQRVIGGGKPPNASSATQSTGKDSQGSGSADDAQRDAQQRQPSSQGTSSGQHGERGVSSPVFEAATVKSIEKVVEDFRSGRFAKFEAIGRIGDTLQITANPTDTRRLTAFASYCSQIDEHERISRESGERGKAASRVTNFESGGHVGDGDGDGDRRDNTSNADAFAAEVIKSVASGSVLSDDRERVKRLRPSGSVASDAELSDEEEVLQSTKKRRVLRRDMPWFEAELRAEALVDPSCLETRETLALFGADPTAAKRFLNESIAKPARFPNTEWAKVLRGECVDIDAVFSSLHNVGPAKESCARVGSSELKFIAVEAAKKVQTFGEWLSAWSLIEKAVGFAFPHRQRELGEYRDYIISEFAAKQPSAHERIILFDAAVRAIVQGGQSTLLTDRRAFSREYSAIVLPDGVAYNSRSSKVSGRSQSGSNSSQGICNRYNSEKGCSNSPCNYRHVCRRCLRTGHGKEKCNIKENSGTGGSA